MTTINVARGEQVQLGMVYPDARRGESFEPYPVYGYRPVVTPDVKVPHRAANLKCLADIGGGLTCRKRAGHRTLKGEKRHVPVDYRILAAPYRVVHEQRFAPGGIPKGVDQTITLPHDCANHLPDVAEVERGYR